MLQRISNHNFPVVRFFDDEWPMPGAMLRSFFGDEAGERPWAPPVDITETEDAYNVTAELPGLTKKDIEISIENNVLTLTGERKFEQEAKGETFHRSERRFGSFARSFTLPRQIDTEGVKAAFKDGLLTLTLPKHDGAKSRKIAIS